MTEKKRMLRMTEGERTLRMTMLWWSGDKKINFVKNP
jgi:hypothetical protein